MKTTGEIEGVRLEAVTVTFYGSDHSLQLKCLPSR